MLRSREHENPDVRRIGQVLAAVNRGMPQRRDSAPVPIFRSGIDLEDLRFLARGHARTEPIAFPGHRVGSGFVTNRELGLRERTKLVRLREAFVEAAKSCGAGLDEQRIDRLAALLIGGEPFIDQLPLPPAGLGRAVGVCVLGREQWRQDCTSATTPDLESPQIQARRPADSWIHR